MAAKKEAAISKRKSNDDSASSSGRLRNANANWYHIINRWLVENLAALNAFFFLLILIAVTIFVMDISDRSIPNGFARFLLGVVAGTGTGIVYCGLFALVLTFCRDITRIATALEQQNQSK
tara:strand:- start:1987 stop:2349 length:363 start_codon:yes stop_codon:yes gene_type:complete